MDNPIITHKCEACSSSFATSSRTLRSMWNEVQKLLCVPCAQRTRRSKARASAFIERVRIKYGQVLDVVEFTDQKSNARFRCGCGQTYDIAPTALLRKSKKAVLSCGRCKSQRPAVKIGKRKVHLTPTEFSVVQRLPINQKSVECSEDLDGVPVKVRKKLRMVKPSFLYKGKAVFIVAASQMRTSWSEQAAIARKASKAWQTKWVIAETAATLPREWWLKDKGSVLESLEARKGPESVTVLALDPGTANHGWAVLQVQSPFKPKVIAHGLIVNTIKEMRGDMAAAASLYLAEIYGIIEQYGCDSLAAERYMTRGIKGTTIECVNAMIGCLLGMSFVDGHGVQKMLMPASQWKNEWNRHSSLDAFYGKVRCVPHQVDSIGIGLYAAAVWLGHKPFVGMKALEKSLIPNINKTNLEA